MGRVVYTLKYLKVTDKDIDSSICLLVARDRPRQLMVGSAGISGGVEATAELLLDELSVAR